MSRSTTASYNILIPIKCRNHELEYLVTPSRILVRIYNTAVNYAKMAKRNLVEDAEYQKASQIEARLMKSSGNDRKQLQFS